VKTPNFNLDYYWTVKGDFYSTSYVAGYMRGRWDCALPDEIEPLIHSPFGVMGLADGRGDKEYD